MNVPQHILDRLGPENAAQRLGREEELGKRRLRRASGAGSLRRFFTINFCTRLGLSLLGLQKLGFRNVLDIHVVENEIILPGLPQAFEGFRLMQLTDLHCDLDPAIMEKISNTMITIPHDAVVLTGDYHNEILNPIDDSLEAMRRFIPLLHPLRLAILGNHDYLEMVPYFEKWGLPVLLNESRFLEREYFGKKERLWICGIDDAHFFGSHDLNRARAGIPEDEITLLLSHTPETHREAALLGYHLHLSGHTHGGQLCLPGGIPIYHNTRGCRKEHLAGPWSEGKMLGYTSRGTGSAGAPARLNCPAEITVHILRSGKAD